MPSERVCCGVNTLNFDAGAADGEDIDWFDSMLSGLSLEIPLDGLSACLVGIKQDLS